MKLKVIALAVIAVLALGACGSTKTVTVKVPGPTITKEVPGPTVEVLPAGCGDAIVAYEKSVNVTDDAFGALYEAVRTGAPASVVNPMVDQVDAALGAQSATDKAAADACFGGGGSTA